MNDKQRVSSPACPCAAERAQLVTVAREWERQSKQWEGVVKAQWGQIVELSEALATAEQFLAMYERARAGNAYLETQLGTAHARIAELEQKNAHYEAEREISDLIRERDNARAALQAMQDAVVAVVALERLREMIDGA